MKRFLLLVLLLLALTGCGGEEKTYTVTETETGIHVAEYPETEGVLQQHLEELGAVRCTLSGQNGAALSLCYTLPDGALLRENRSAEDGRLLTMSDVWDLSLVADLLTRSDWYQAEDDTRAWAQSLEPEDILPLLEQAEGYLTEEELILTLPQGTFTLLRRNITLY